MVRAFSRSYDDPKTPSAEASDWLGLAGNILAQGEQMPAALWICKHLEPLTIDRRKRHLIVGNDVDRIRKLMRLCETPPSTISKSGMPMKSSMNIPTNVSMPVRKLPIHLGRHNPKSSTIRRATPLISRNRNTRFIDSCMDGEHLTWMLFGNEDLILSRTGKAIEPCHGMCPRTEKPPPE